MTNTSGGGSAGHPIVLRRVGAFLGGMALLIGTCVVLGVSLVTFASASTATSQSDHLLVSHDTSASYTNPDPCNASVANGVCISQLGVQYGQSSITLTMTVGYADPYSCQWYPDNSYVDWTLTPTATSDDNPTRSVGIMNVNGSVLEANSEDTASFDASTDEFTAVIPATLWNIPSFSLSASFFYDAACLGNSGPYTTAVAPAGGGTCCTVNSPATEPPTPTPTPPTAPPTPEHGYWLVGSDGGIFNFGSANFYGSTGSLRLQRPVVGITPTADRGGYWLVASDGGVFSFGDSGFYGSIPGLGLHPAGSGVYPNLNAPIVGMVPSADGGGYFMVASDGGLFAFGDAHFAGACPGIGGCLGAAVAVMPDASGNGYWLVTSAGYVYAFGDATNYGQPAPQSVLVTSAVRTPDGGGYWILFANGAVAPYGDAGAYGDTPSLTGGWNPSTAIFTTSDGDGYWIASANGTVYDLGDAPNDGGMAGTHLNGSIIAATGF